MIFWNFRQYDAKAYVLSLPEEGDGHTDWRTDGGIISPLAKCMRINSNKGWEWRQSQEKREEKGMSDREGRVRWESEKCMVLDGRYWYFTILPMILAGRYWNSRFQRLILWGVLSIWRKKYQFYGVFWGRRELSTVKYIGDFLKFQTVWCKSIGFELPRGGGRTHARTHARRNNQLRAQPSDEMHENKLN